VLVPQRRPDPHRRRGLRQLAILRLFPAASSACSLPKAGSRRPAAGSASSVPCR